MPYLKICGITRTEDLAVCHDAGVDFVGFNIYQGSKRYIAPADAGRIWSDFKKMCPHSTIKAVLVSVDASLRTLLEAAQHIPDLAAFQLHGREPAALISELKNVQVRPVWKAFPVSRADQHAAIAAMQGAVDLLLLDSAAVPQGASVPGGSGKAFDWQAYGDLIAAPWIGVAGGIHPGNIGALLKFRPHLIDIASGAEAAPGVKSSENIESLAAACKTLA